MINFNYLIKGTQIFKFHRHKIWNFTLYLVCDAKETTKWQTASGSKTMCTVTNTNGKNYFCNFSVHLSTVSQKCPYTTEFNPKQAVPEYICKTPPLQQSI